MKNLRSIKVLWIAIFALMISAAYSVSAQTLKEIHFAKGKSSAMVRGVTGGKGVIYVIRAKANQEMTIGLMPISNVFIQVETDGPDGHKNLLVEEKGGTYKIELVDGGDYTIFVNSADGGPLPFTLTVKITTIHEI